MGNNKELKEMLAKNVSSIFTDLIDEKIENERKEGTSFYEKNIIKDMKISKSAFTHYKNGNDGNGKEAKPKLPDLVSLYKMHKYFDVSYSYLLGETPTKSIDNLDIGVNLGLNDLSIQRLKALNYRKNDMRRGFELFLINCIITSDEFISLFSHVILEKLSLKVSKENGIDVYDDISKFNEMFDFKKYRLSNLMSEFVDEICCRKDIPSVVIDGLIEKPFHKRGPKKVDETTE